MTDFGALRAIMVEGQLRRRGITDAAVLAAFAEVPRELFVPATMAGSAYDDGPLPIGSGQTISQPYIVARMIEAAGVRAGMRVFEVGAGSGYAAAVLSRIAAEVFAIERHESLASQARERVSALGYENCRIVAGDGMAGLAGEAPFDAVLVAARGHEVPDALAQQLAIGGRLIIPIGGEDVQQLRCVERLAQDDWASHDVTSVRFVPLLQGTVSDEGRRGGSQGESLDPQRSGGRCPNH